MHLSAARLCLDCQEIHDLDRCPVCTSEAFGFITRWVTVDAAPRHVTTNEPRTADSTRIDSYRQILNPRAKRSSAARWLGKGGLLIAAGYLARLGWQIASQRTPSSDGAPAAGGRSSNDG